MPAPAPLISLVMVCRNPGPRLAAALASIWTQSNPPPHEIIAIDGASTDGTAAWLAQQAAQLNHWVSAAADGIYDAMNRGVAAATGDWIYFLGSDDRLASVDTLAEVASALRTCREPIASGRARFDDGRVYAYSRDHAAIRRNYLHHQATFYRRSLFAECGLFDTTFRAQADYEFNLRLRRARQPISSLSLLIAECASGGFSDSGQWLNYREEITVRHRYFPTWPSVLWDLASVLRYGRKIFVRSQAKHRPE